MKHVAIASHKSAVRQLFQEPIRQSLTTTLIKPQFTRIYRTNTRTCTASCCIHISASMQVARAVRRPSIYDDH